MTPETMFQIANPIAMLGWIALLVAPFAPRAVDLIADLRLPVASIKTQANCTQNRLDHAGRRHFHHCVFY